MTKQHLRLIDDWLSAKSSQAHLLGVLVVAPTSGVGGRFRGAEDGGKIENYKAYS